MVLGRLPICYNKVQLTMLLCVNCNVSPYEVPTSYS